MASTTEVTVHIDGASRGNPGPAAYGVVMESAGGERLAGLAESLGVATNNVAEYRALLAALEYALGHHYLRLRVRTDSELLALQVRGVYRVKSPGLKPLHQQARQLIGRLESFSIEHVPREQNREADRLANRALDAAAAGKRRAPLTDPPLPHPRARVAGGSEEEGPPTTPRAGTSSRAPAASPRRSRAAHGQQSLFEGETGDFKTYRKE
jgi:probable phosphoglycerate mutase